VLATGTAAAVIVHGGRLAGQARAGHEGRNDRESHWRSPPYAFCFFFFGSV
jgi:hypothetical protein